MSIYKRLGAVAVAGVVLFSGPAFAADALGTWNIVADTQMGQFQSTLTVAERDGGYVVEIADVPMEASAGAPAMPPMDSTISDVDVSGSQLNFKRSFTGAFAMALTYRLVVEGDTLKGEAASDFGPTAISGTRVQ